MSDERRELIQALAVASYMEATPINDWISTAIRDADALLAALDAERKERDALAAKLNLANEAYVEMNKLWLDEMKFRCSVEIKRDALAAENERLREAQRDARRWRWLFNHPDGKAARFNSVWRLWDGKSDWGEAIDAAIAKEPTT